MGADPVAFVTAGVAATRGRPLKAFSVRKEAKDHGGGGRIAGALDPGDKVVVTEDTVTRGTSLLEAARAVREAGADPILLVAVVDRGGTAAAMAAAEGLPFRAILTAPDLGLRLRGRLRALFRQAVRPSGRRAPAPHDRVDGDRGQQHQGGGDLLSGRAHPDEGHAVDHRRDEDAAEQGVDRLAVAAEEAGPADHRGGDGVEHIGRPVDSPPRSTPGGRRRRPARPARR